MSICTQSVSVSLKCLCVCAFFNLRPNSKTCNASKHVKTEQNINNAPFKDVMATSSCSEGDFVSVMAVRRTDVETWIDLQLYFLPLALKTHASVIAVYADAKVIFSVRMIEADISPIASEWADALLRKVGCQVSALITQWAGWEELAG